MRRLLLSLFGAAALLFPLDLAAANHAPVYGGSLVQVHGYRNQQRSLRRFHRHRRFHAFRHRHGWGHCRRHGWGYHRRFRHRPHYYYRFGPVVLVPRV